ncbi:TTK protein kinase [Phytophthora megakarya]|uniref:TTK protein kinase n=1 Tax=Phytophthora megakarya TaxID=4795 RepID=A0A225V903_9STRA|nr:TTK protein kinase [Phytophthora megakarya]
MLHFGENARAIFMLEKPSERRLRLVIALKNAPRSVAKWLELLRCPLTGNPGNYNKLRLVRRALTCVDSTEARQTAGYTEMCIMMAKLNDTEAGVRMHFHEMKKRRVGEKQPLRYEEEAAFEYAAGNKETAEEILEQGVDNDVFTPKQKDEMMKKVIAGRAGWVAAFSGSPQEQKVLAFRTRMQALRRTQDDVYKTQSVDTTPRGLNNRVTTPLHRSSHPADTTPISQSRGRDDSASSSTTTPNSATPVSHPRNGVGFSTVSKVRHANKSPLLTTPSVPTRSSHKSQSTSRKPPLRFQLGTENVIALLTFPRLLCYRILASTGAPLRVLASNDQQSDDDDDDDAMMGSQASPTIPNKTETPTKPTKEVCDMCWSLISEL